LSFYLRLTLVKVQNYDREIMHHLEKPKTDEYSPNVDMYLDLLPDDGLILKHLENNLKATLELVSPLPEEKGLYRYAKDKWTLKQVLVHIMDDERIYAYRALRFARNDKTELSGYESDDYTRYAEANDRTLESILEEYTAVRKATIALFKNLSEEAFSGRGVANGNLVTVRALAYHIAGHELHHIQIIKEKYLGSLEL
jgi:uncharacterized damage-inducible protein DinB